MSLKDNMTVEEFLASACGKRGLNAAEHFVRVKKRRDMDNSNHFVPHRTDLIESYVIQKIFLSRQNGKSQLHF